MYALHLRTGRSITSADLQYALGKIDAEPGTGTHATRMMHLGHLERLEARGMQYSNQDFDVLSAALNFMDAVAPEHGLRNPLVTLSTGRRCELVKRADVTEVIPTDGGELTDGEWLEYCDSLAKNKRRS